MAVEDVRHKIELIFKSKKLNRLTRSFGYQRLYNWEPFSVRKTASTLEDIFGKLLNVHKSQHNKKYLQSLFPYYVFYDSIIDLNGKVVLLITKENINTYTTIYLFSVAEDFYNKYKEQVDNLYYNYGGGADINYNPYKPKLEISNVDDVYFVFHKQYTFDSISQLKEFKVTLRNEIAARLLEKKNTYCPEDNILW